MTAATDVHTPSTDGPFPPTFRAWRASLQSDGVPPVIAVGGSRGKSTIVRLLDAIFRAAGLRTALWTDNGVEINARRQRGELGPWSRAVARLADGTLDVAVQELAWDTVHAVGLPGAAYPVVVVTNLCVNSDSCLVQAESARALGALGRVRDAAHPNGFLILSGEDFSVGAEAAQAAAPLLTGASRDTPLLRHHLASAGTAAWTESGRIVVGTSAAPMPITTVDRVPLVAGGAVGFQVQNVLTAAAAAAACGIAPSTIADALHAYDPPTRLMPGSFNVIRVGESTVVVDRPAPSWFLRPAIRAIGHLRWRRLLTVVGRFDGVPAVDLPEIGRLLGRGGGALVLHGESAEPRRAALLRKGIAANDVPPVVVRVSTERQAVAQALRMLRPDDLAFVLAEQPSTVLRALDRARERSAA